MEEQIQCRCSGRTTRLIDSFIQCLFENPEQYIRIFDHYPGNKATQEIIFKIKRRLEFEHNCTIVPKYPGSLFYKIKNLK